MGRRGLSFFFGNALQKQKITGLLKSGPSEREDLRNLLNYFFLDRYPWQPICPILFRNWGFLLNKILLRQLKIEETIGIGLINQSPDRPLASGEGPTPWQSRTRALNYLKLWRRNATYTDLLEQNR